MYTWSTSYSFMCFNGHAWILTPDLYSGEIFHHCFLCVYVRESLIFLVSLRTLSVWLFPPGPDSHNRNNKHLFYCVAANQTTFKKKKDSGGQGWALSLPLSLLSLSLSHISHTHNPRISLWHPLSCVSRDHHGYVFSSKGLWPKFMDPRDLVPVSKKNLLHCWDSRSIRRNPPKQSWLTYTLEIFTVYGWCLCLISSLLHAPVDHFLYWVCMRVPWYFLWLFLCIAEVIHDFQCCFRQRKYTQWICDFPTLCHTHTQTFAVVQCYIVPLPHKYTKMSAFSFMPFVVTDTNEPKISIKCAHFTFPDYLLIVVINIIIT